MLQEDVDSDTTGGTRSDGLLNDSDDDKKVKNNSRRIDSSNKKRSMPPQKAPRVYAHTINKMMESANCIVFARHAETASAANPTWLKDSFSNKEYKPFDLNLSRKLPERADAAVNYAADPPLTILGTKVAAILGREFARIKLRVRIVYTSPTLSCVETASRFLSQAIDGEAKPPKIRVEPALLDFAADAKDAAIPKFMIAKECIAAGIDVDDAYKPAMSLEQAIAAAKKETPDTFAQRIYEAVQGIIKANNPLGVVLIVTHARVMHVAARCLLGKAFRPHAARPGATSAELAKTDANYPPMSLLSLAPTSVIDPADTPAMPCFSNARTFHRLAALGGGGTSQAEHALWHQVYGIMPHFTAENYSNHFNCHFLRRQLT